MKRHNSQSVLRRWVKFNFVGLIGIAVQLAVLELLVAVGLDYRVATLLAVEAAVLHNFCWHVCYTWRDRAITGRGLLLQRLLQFHLTNGIISMAGSFTLTYLLVGRSQLPVISANLISIAACSILNFVLSEVVVFRRTRRRRPRASRAVSPEYGFTGPHLLPFGAERG